MFLFPLGMSEIDVMLVAILNVHRRLFDVFSKELKRLRVLYWRLHIIFNPILCNVRTRHISNLI